MATDRATRAAVREIARLAGSPARAAAVEAVLAGCSEDADPDDGDRHAARRWAEAAVAFDGIDRASVRRAVLERLRHGDLEGAVRALRQLPPHELAPFAEALARVGRR